MLNTVITKRLLMFVRYYWYFPVLILLVVSAFLLRVLPVYSQVFLPDGSVVFTTNDAWWHMRIIDNLVANFPHLNQVDPYQSLSTGELLDRVHLFDWSIAFIAWTSGLGHPSALLVDSIAAYFPAVLGALTLIPVYLICATLFAPWVGLFSAALVAILPGEFLGRSTLGSTDTHVMESLLLALMMCFLILSLKYSDSASQQFFFLKKRRTTTKIRPVLPSPYIGDSHYDVRTSIIFVFFAGVTYSAYILTWVGAIGIGLLVVFFFTIVSVIIHCRRKYSTGWSTITLLFLQKREGGMPRQNGIIDPLSFMSILGVVFFLPALIVSLLFTLGPITVMTISLFTIYPIFLLALSRLLPTKLPSVVYPVSIVLLASVAILVVGLVSPVVLSSLISNFKQLLPSVYIMVSEMQPLFNPSGSGFTWRMAWANYGITLWLGSVGLLYLVISSASSRLRSFPILLLIIWCLVLLLANIAQRRYGYYFAINIAILSGCAVWLLSRSVFWLFKRQVAVLLFVIPACIMVLYSFLSPSISMVSGNAFTVPIGWQESLKWLRDNSPDPFASADPATTYYSLYRKPPIGTPYQFPLSVYSVTAWTDYGYWITRIAHRLPVDNPGHLPFPSRDLFRLFMSSDPSEIRALESKLRTGYIMLDYQTVVSKFMAILSYYGESPDKYTYVYQVVNPKTKSLDNVRVFFPDYYKAMMINLFITDGKGYIPGETIVISVSGHRINEARKFARYDDAVAYTATHPNTMVVGMDPIVSSVPLVPIDSHVLIHSYGGSVTDTVKTFRVD